MANKNKLKKRNNKKSLKEKKNPHWIKDWKNYPISNRYYKKGVKPPIKIDKDGDRVVDSEDCSKYNPKKQGLFSKKQGGSKVGNIIRKITKKKEPQAPAKLTTSQQSSFKKIVETARQQSIDVSQTPSAKMVSQPTPSSGRGGGGGRSPTPSPTTTQQKATQVVQAAKVTSQAPQSQASQTALEQKARQVVQAARTTTPSSIRQTKQAIANIRQTKQAKANIRQLETTNASKTNGLSPSQTKQAIANIKRSRGKEERTQEVVAPLTKEVLQTKDIKKKGDLKVNVTGVSTRVSDRKDDRVGLGTHIRNFFTGDFFSGGKAGFKEETYDPRTGLVSAASEPSGQATVLSRPETPGETEKRDIFPTKAGRFIFGEKKSEQLITADPRNIEKAKQDYMTGIKKYGESSDEIIKISDEITILEKGNVDVLGETWTGSQKDFDNYQQVYKKYQSKIDDSNKQKQKLLNLGATETNGQISPPTIKSGVFGLTRDIPITSLPSSKDKPVSFGSKVAASTIGSTYGKGTERTLDFFGYKGKTIPSKDIIIREPEFGTRTTDTGFIEKGVTTPEKVRTSETIGRGVSKGVETGIQLGKYLIPYAGGAIFAGEVTEAGVGIGKTLSEGEKLTPEQKKELLILGGTLLTLGALKYGGKILKLGSGVSKAEKANYNKVLEEVKNFNKSQKPRVIETNPAGTMSVELSDIQVNNLINSGAFNSIKIAKNNAKNVKSVKVSQSTQKLSQKYMDMKKVAVPKEGKLYKIQKNAYYSEMSERTLYRNIITYEVKLASGQIQTISVVSFTAKPLTKFRSLDSALKYGRGKEVIVGSKQPGSDISQFAKVKETKEGLKIGDKFLAKADKGKTEVRKVGALEKYEQDVDQLFKYSEPVGRGKVLAQQADEPSRLFTPLFEADTKVSRSIAESRTQASIADLSIAKRISDVKAPPRRGLPPERRTPLDKTFAREAGPTRVDLVNKPQMLEPIKMEARMEAPTKLADQEISSQVVSQISKTPTPRFKGLTTKAKPQIKTTNLLLSSQRSSQQLLSSVTSKDKLSERQRKATIERTDLFPKNLSIVKEDVIIKQEVTPKETIKFKQDLSLKQIQEPIQIIGTTISPKPPSPIPPKPKPPKPKPPIYINPRLARAKFTKQEPYDSYVRRDSLDKRKKRWEKVNERPLTKRSARSLMAREVDQSISAQGKIVKRPPIIQKVKKAGKVIRKVQKQVGAYDTKDKYYEKNQHKFREFKSRKGTRTPLPTGQYIELQKHRLDHPLEKRGISLFRRR